MHKLLVLVFVSLSLLSVKTTAADEALQCETVAAYNIQTGKAPEKDNDQITVKSYINIVDDTLAINYYDTKAEILKHYYTQELGVSDKVFGRSFISRPDGHVMVFVLRGDRCSAGDEEARKATWSATYSDGTYVEMLTCTCG